ncbi:hypothetical protein V6N11_015311 [Hibiscus sabdariffa]|uniref:Uncharacterized protein n=1 Tax=Hibiscus sabdariffa TaxID=183260 RepID=A0ABR2TS75_9ROSI
MVISDKSQDCRPLSVSAFNKWEMRRTSVLKSENPLHVASAAGHTAGYVREILRLRPEYAKELNKDGFSPLHTAAANGHIEVVRELLNVDKKLGFVEGRDNKTPLHFAAMEGRVDVIGEMLSCCAECIEGVTVQKETGLHLAIMNSQFGAIKVMVQWILERQKEELLNLKDEQGNTILHLVTWKKQRQASIFYYLLQKICLFTDLSLALIRGSVCSSHNLVIELLLGFGTTSSGLLEVNAVNQCGLTALDVLQMFSSKAGDREIAEAFQRTGAVRAR